MGIGDVMSGGWDMNGILYPSLVTLCTHLSCVKACQCALNFNRHAPTRCGWSEDVAVVNGGLV